jgi:hypothetical protein
VAVDVALAVVVAGVIFVGHDDVCDYDHPSSLQLPKENTSESGLGRAETAPRKIDG